MKGQICADSVNKLQQTLREKHQQATFSFSEIFWALRESEIDASHSGILPQVGGMSFSAGIVVVLWQIKAYINHN